MAPSIAAVRQNGADLGIVLDTDVDRSGVVDSAGEAINRNRLIAFLATVVLRDSPGTTIVTDSTTSNGLTVRQAMRVTCGSHATGIFGGGRYMVWDGTAVAEAMPAKRLVSHDRCLTTGVS